MFCIFPCSLLANISSTLTVQMRSVPTISSQPSSAPSPAPSWRAYERGRYSPWWMKGGKLAFLLLVVLFWVIRLLTCGLRRGIASGLAVLISSSESSENSLVERVVLVAWSTLEEVLLSNVVIVLLAFNLGLLTWGEMWLVLYGSGWGKLLETVEVERASPLSWCGFVLPLITPP